MIMDKLNQFSDQQAVTSTAASTNYVDLGAARDVGQSDVMIMVTVTETATAAGAATVTFSVEADNDSAFGSATTLFSTAAIGKATLVAGYQFFIPVPPAVTPERYLQMRYTVATGPLTAGKFTAAVVHGVQKNYAYPNAL